MKQTNNAIKFLMAQYRAIFKNAYFKGMATALVLTAGLAAGANTAQAAHDGSFYELNAAKDTFKEFKTALPNDTSSKLVIGIGGYETATDAHDKATNGLDGIVDGATLSFGGTNDDSIGSAGTASGAYAGYVKLETSANNAVANNNKLHINGVVNFGSSPSDGAHAVGGWAVHKGNGTATAQGNEVKINANASTATTKGNATINGQIIGAWASSLNGAAALDNIVEINGSGATAKMALQDSVFGGLAAAEAQAKSGTFRAQGNQLTITNASLTSGGKMIMGGYVRSLGTNNATVNDFNASNNIVTLNNVTVSGGAAANANIVAANYADAQQTSNSLTINSVTANGTEGQTSLTIHGGEYSNTNILGGYAATSGGSGIDVSANFNSVAMDKGATITSGGVYGARIISNSSDKVTITGSNNSISIAANDAKTIKNHTHNSIYGSFVSGAFGTNASGSTITANNNKVTIGDFNIFNLDTSKSGSNFAAAYIVTDKSGAAITASNNTVEVYGDVVGYQDGDDVKAGLIAGAMALDKGYVTMNNNKVTIGGKVTDGLVAGAYSTTDNIKMGTTNERVVPTMTGNSVTITADAELLNTDIYAVYSAANKGATPGSTVMATNNDVTVSGKVTNSHIYGGMGADSVITLDSSSKYIAANDSTTASPYKIQSDVVNVAGELRISNGNAVTIQGYAANGSLGDTEVDTNSTTIASSAKVFNYGTLTLRGETDVQDGATLAALNTNANIVVDASNIKTEVDPNKATNPDPDLDYKLTGGKAALVISDDLLSSYLNPAAGSKVTIDNQEHDVTKGSLYVTKLGAVDFRDSVVLSNFDFANSQTPGKIQIDTDAYNEATGSGSVFRADTVTIEHKLAENATTYDGQHKNLVNVTTAGVAIEADVLNLGSSNLTSSQSAEIGFAQAKVKDTINFIARTSGEDVSGDGTPNTGVINNGYHLTSQVIGSNFMLTNDQDAAKEYYTSLAGDINGVVTVQDTGKLHIQDGDWTANDLVTVTSGGSILVGGESAVKGKLQSINNNVREPDATLSLAAGLVLDVSQGDTATVTANGDNTSAYQEPDADDFYGDNRYVELDLTNGVDMKVDSDGTISGSAVIDATSGGVILLNASDVNDILAQNHAWNGKASTNNHSGAFFKASAGGELRVDGDITAQFRDFDNDPNTNGFNLSGDTATGLIEANDSGRLVANSLTIVNPHSGTVLDDEDYVNGTANPVYLGGVVIVDDLEINDLQQTNGEKPTGSNTYASQVTIANGGALISHSLTSFNDKLILGDEGNSSAILYFETDAVADEGTISVNKIELASGSEIDFANGKWDASATDFNLSGAGSSLIVGDDYDYDVNENPYSATLKAGDLTMGDGTYLYVAANGTASFNGANLEELSAPTADNDKAGILVEGYLTINGTAISDTNKNGGVTFGEAGSIRIANNGTLNFGKAAVNGAIVADGQHTGDTVTLRDGYSKIDNQGGTLRLDLADNTKFSANAIQSLKKQLFTDGSFNSDGILKAGGLLNIGKANFDGFSGYDKVDDPAKGLYGYTATWDEVKDFSDIFSEDVTNDMNSTANITGIEPGDEVKGAWGSLSMNPNVPTTAQVTLAGNTTLSYAEGNNGLFISDNDHKIALGAIVGSQKTFNLVNGGSIGKVTLTNGKDNANDDRNLTTLNINGNGNLTTINGIDTVISNNTTAYATRVNVNSDADVTGDITGVGRVNVNEGATLHVYNPDATSKDVPEVLVNTLAVRNGNAQIDGDLIIDGNYNSQNEGFGGEGEAYAVGGTITATNIELEHDAALTTVHGGLISAETVTAVADTNGQSDSLITVGQDLDYETWDDTEEAAYTGTGYLEISKYLDLNGGTLMVDPVYGEATSVAAVMNFKEGNDKTWDSVKNDVGIIDGRALIGKNAALGIGASLEDTRAVIADFQENGSLSQEKYGSILYLNGQLTIANGSEIALNADPVTSDVDGIRRALKYTITSNQLDQFATLGLGANTAILMSEAAFEDADGKKTQTAIHFDRESAVINANGGEIVLIGAFDASEKLNFFSDNDSGNNNGVDIVNASGADGTIKVYTQNGFLFATLTGKNQGQGVQLHVDEDKAFSVMNQASYPVVETLISYHEDRIAQDTTTTPDTGSENQSGSASIPATDIQTQSTETEQQLASRTTDEQTTRETIPAETVEPQEQSTPNAPVANTRVTGSSDFLNEVVTKSHGAPAEAAARLAIYGGAVQAAMAATSSTTDAIAARMGVGNTANITMANNGQGAALWLAPVYKTHDSDSFDSQGLDYGVDLNLYGVALGADFEFMPGLTAGIMFNVGSGDADGQGNAAANNTSNDFDYWGAAIYGNYTYDALSVTADVSYTAVDNDLEATTGMQQYGKLESSTDTTAISLGVTAKYTFDFGGVEVAPHAGLRYTNIDLDDYSIKSNGETIADYSADKVNIFSIPVGVTFAKEFTGDAWTVKPSLDLTLTGNFGDDDISGDVSWTGVDGLVTPVSSEYMDDFTYGATLGIEAASTGGFSLGLGVNYTGSSNVDEFGVNANARFVF